MKNKMQKKFMYITTLRGTYFGEFKKKENVYEGKAILVEENLSPEETSRKYVNSEILDETKKVRLEPSKIESIVEGKTEEKIIKSLRDLAKEAEKRARAELTVKYLQELVLKISDEEQEI